MKKSGKKLSEKTYILLHDPDFLQWYLMPTKELDTKWEQWQKQHPENQKDLEEAREILSQTRLNEYKMPAAKSEQLWKRLEQSMEQKVQKRQTHRRKLYVRYIAACAILLLISIIVPEVFDKYRKENTKIEFYSLGEIISSPEEVTLITDTKETIKVEDNALITYDTEIVIKGKETEETIVKKGETETNVFNSLLVPRGRRSSIILADGSKVWVNSGSRVCFPTQFDANQRIIEVEGEIYIEVAPSETPFYVRTNDFTVQVLGTCFNVSAYAGENTSSVVLVTGSVQVNTKSNEPIILHPDYKLTVESGKNRIDPVDVLDYISWKDGWLQFNDETMENMLIRLSRYYNIPVRCNTKIGQKESSGKLILFDDFDQVIEVLSMLYDIQYYYDSDTLIVK